MARDLRHGGHPGVKPRRLCRPKTSGEAIYLSEDLSGAAPWSAPIAA